MFVNNTFMVSGLPDEYVGKMVEKNDNYRFLLSDWQAYPDDQSVKYFKDLLSSHPVCPICGGEYAYNNTSHMGKHKYKYDICCMNSAKEWITDFHCTFTRSIENTRGHRFIRKYASFSINTRCYEIWWHSKLPKRVRLTLFDEKTKSYARRVVKTLYINFGSIEKWFIPQKDLDEVVSKYRILM